MTRWAWMGVCTLLTVGCDTSSDDDGGPPGTGGATGTGGTTGTTGTGGATGTGGTTGTGGAVGSGGGQRIGPGGGSYCDDHEHWPVDFRTCMQDSDCATGQRCSDTWYAQPCTLGCAASLTGCYEDAECLTDQLCTQDRQQAYVAPQGNPLPPMPICSCGDGATGYSCTAPCTEGSCIDDELCGGDGHCAPKRCDGNDGYSCPEGTACDPAADDHGCRVLTCEEPGARACPVNSDCVSSPAGPAQCIVRSCSTATECDCGSCRMLPSVDENGLPTQIGYCRGRPGICIMETQAF